MTPKCIEIEIDGYTKTGEKVHLIDTFDKSCFAKYNHYDNNPSKKMVIDEILRKYSHLFCFNISKCTNPWVWGTDWDEDLLHCMPVEKDVFYCKWDFLNGQCNYNRLEIRLDNK